MLVPVVLLGLEVSVRLGYCATEAHSWARGGASVSVAAMTSLLWNAQTTEARVAAAPARQLCSRLGGSEARALAYGSPCGGLESRPRKFWVRTSPLEVQMILATMASLLAEITDKRELVQGMMPIVSNIATLKNMYPTYYAIPVIVGAFSNLIMPASVPLVILHEVARVSFLKLFILGLLLKLLIITMVLITVNSAGKMVYGFGKAAIYTVEH
ncbi:hypothetical protein HPB47_016304 [Ixodes persulcatus]|uniref:Uncharacterized protein n=1 Tax=Ixodes persulcatus TaxID=34615 RepID=A0AC60QRB3_IXOPE|nr:hypothetical protein HPB47_016304 [Ixodes persulcatus]